MIAWCFIVTNLLSICGVYNLPSWLVSLNPFPFWNLLKSKIRFQLEMFNSTIQKNYVYTIKVTLINLMFAASDWKIPEWCTGGYAQLEEKWQKTCSHRRWAVMWRVVPTTAVEASSINFTVGGGGGIWSGMSFVLGDPNTIKR